MNDPHGCCKASGLASGLLLAFAGLLMAAGAWAQAPATPLGLGRSATPDEIRALDIDAAPDGRGLPDGRGTVAEGATIYATKCAACGGDFSFATNGRLVRTVGSYWPYATTLYDYTFRAMPFAQPGTLSPNETYGVVAYVLFLNGLIGESAVMDRTSLPKVVMPAHDRFVPDNRKGGAVVK
jgi:cytochrome c